MSLAALAIIASALAGQALAVEWDVSLWGQRRASTEHVHRLAELVAEKTQGEFTMDIHYGDLSRPAENLDGIGIGAFEMAQFCAAYHPDKSPTLTVLGLPFLGISSFEEDIAVSRAVFAHPAVAADLARWKARLLMPSPLPPYEIVGVGKPPETLEGVRIGANGDLAKALEAAGAVPTAMTAPEAKEALKSGIVDAVALAPDAHKALGTIELGTWWTDDLAVAAETCPVAVGIAAYDALSPEHRDALDSSIDEALATYVEGYETLLDGWSDVIDEKRLKRVHLPLAEVAKAREAAGPVLQQWIAGMAARGLPGEELYALVQETLEAERETR